MLQQKLIEVAKDMNTETLMLQKLQKDNEILTQEIVVWKDKFADARDKASDLNSNLDASQARVSELLEEV